ncbi:MAG: HEAT repeat domain-containing protein [Holosporaceae bacterium]|jgi:hypothetical protein|nr:HEAT repeat domain-containing protein [Rhodospirillaceae bacterium]
MKTEDYIARLQDRCITNREGRREAVDALVPQADNSAVQVALLDALSDTDIYVGWAAAEALAPKAEDPEFQSALLKSLEKDTLKDLWQTALENDNPGLAKVVLHVLSHVHMELPVEELPSSMEILPMAKYSGLEKLAVEVYNELVDREPSRVDLPSPHTYTR